MQWIQDLKKFRNPFKEAGLWIRGEMLDIQGMQNAFKSRENVVKALQNCEQKNRDDIEELEKLQLGKATLKSFFKSKESKQADIVNLEKVIKSRKKTIEDYKKLIDYIYIY